MDLPGRMSGKHLCVGLLVQEEATKMMKCAPYLGSDVDKATDEMTRVSRLEELLWGWLRTGWTRVDTQRYSDKQVMLHWHPEKEDWVEFTTDLHNYYTTFEPLQDLF